LKRSTPKSPNDDGGSSSSDDSSDDDSYDPADRIPDEPKKQSSCKVREERKQKLYQYLLKNAKTVRDDRTSFKRLAQNSDPKSHRTSYNEWIKQVKKCCQMLPEFDNLFDPTDPTFVGTVSKKYADEALDLLLNSEVNNTMANDLETYQGGCDKDDQTSGVHVLRYLQRRFAPVDDIDEQVEARRNLEALARSDNERMTHFNARFNAKVQYVRSCGIPILPRDQLPQYLRTLRSCEARDIYYQVVVIPNALNQANPSPLRTSKKDSNNVTTKPSVISDHRPHQRAAIDNQRILIILPVRRMPAASSQWSTLERSNVERMSHNIGG